MVEDKKTVEAKERWYDLNKIWKWITTEPEITDKDLRPYYYACKEKMDYFSGKLDIENPIIRINTAFKGCSSLEKISVLPRIYHN